MTFDLRQKLFFIMTSILVIGIAMSYSVYSEIRLTKNYLLDVFTSLNNEFETITGDLKLKADAVRNQLDMSESVFVDEKSSQNLRINTYPERGSDEYGFNQGIYPDTVALGSLYGYGRIPRNFDKEQFLILDRIWSGYQASLLNTQPFVTNYKDNYVYLISLNKFGLFDQPMFDSPISPERYRVGLDGSAEASIDTFGYFISTPITTMIDKNRRILFIIPLYNNDDYIGDLGNSIRVQDLRDLLNIYPELDKNLDVALSYKSGVNVSLSQIEYKTWTAYSFDYNLLGDISISVQYDLMYFVKQELQLFLVLFLLAVIMFGYRTSIAKKKSYQDRLLRQLDIDPMTQLYNRRAIDNQIIPKVREIKATTQIGVIAIDADKFKVINDTYGHHVGDKAIKYIAKKMNDFIRDGDFCIRMGGDEFLIVLFDVDQQEAENIANRLAEKIKTSSKHAIGIEFSVTCAAVELNENESFDDVYKRVDDGLYKNKKA